MNKYKLKFTIPKGYLGVMIVILSFTVLQNISIKILGMQFSICIFTYIILLCTLGFSKHAKVDDKKMAVYALMLICSLISVLINGNQNTFSSYYMFLLIYFFFTIDLFFSDKMKARVQNIFEHLLLISALFGVLQFLIQLTGGNYLSFTDILPARWKLSGFNTYYPISYGSNINKSNGYFFLEPSFFSQFMALGVVIEMNKKKRITRLVILGLGLLSSFSGTGIVLLIPFLIPLLKKMKPCSRYMLLIVGCVILVVFLRTEYSSTITKRIFEIKDPKSSAAIRFVNPIIAIFDRSLISILFGSGAGSCNTLYNQSVANFGAVQKVLYEYGVLTLIPYIVLIEKALFCKTNRIFSLSVIIMYLFLGGNLLQPVIAFFSYFIVNIYFNLYIELEENRIKTNYRGNDPGVYR